MRRISSSLMPTAI